MLLAEEVLFQGFRRGAGIWVSGSLLEARATIIKATKNSLFIFDYF